MTGPLNDRKTSSVLPPLLLTPLPCPPDTDCSGNLDDYWRVLQKDGNLTAEKMAKFQNPITSTPMHLPQLINGESL